MLRVALVLAVITLPPVGLAASFSLREEPPQVLHSFPLSQSVYAGVSSEFGPRIFKGTKEFHQGIDLAAPIGTSVLSWKEGVVDSVISDRICGLGVRVKTKEDDFYWYHTYCHLASIEVLKGQSIEVGNVLGYVGNTGRTLGPHLHFQIEKQFGDLKPFAVNPRPLLEEVDKRSNTSFMRKTYVRQSSEPNGPYR